MLGCRPLSSEDRTLLWRFRFALTADKRALTKFLKCVDWSDASEARQVGLFARAAPSTLGGLHSFIAWSGLHGEGLQQQSVPGFC